VKEKVIVSWSSGKDSALALYEIGKAQEYEVACLLTTVTEDYQRISMHGVRQVLLAEQAASLGCPLEKVLISKNGSNEDYESAMRRVLEKYEAEGIGAVVFGDIFLEDLRNYRQSNLEKIGMKGLFPIWKRQTTELANTFIDLGFKAVVTCVDSNFLDGKFAGREYDSQFLAELPDGVDPCGENGEFHSFVYDGPIFDKPISHTKGEIVLRDERFWYGDLSPLTK